MISLNITLLTLSDITMTFKFREFLLFNFFIPGAFFVFAICLMPIQQVFQFDSYDEGIELIKVSLHSQGFAMYTGGFWNDQPPLSTIILSFWLQLFGTSIFTARLLTLSFSTILVWSFCQIIRIYSGNSAAIIGTLLLIISGNFLRLSVSVMFGLPSLALATFSVYILVLYKQKSRHNILVVISGILFALSLQIKLFTAFLIPLIIFDLIKYNLTKNSQSSKLKLFIDMALWIIPFLITFIIIGTLTNSLSYEQLLKSHINDSVKTAFDYWSSIKLTLLFLLQDFDYFLLATLSIIVIFQKRQWDKIFPIAWLLTGFILLLNHRPVWYHHYLLISIPLTWLASYGITLSYNFFRQSNWYFNFHLSRLKKLTLSGFASGFLILSILVIPIKIGIIQLENHQYIVQSQERIGLVNIILANKKSTHWFFTDCPIYAFYSGLNIPPEIAVLSQIRIDSKSITSSQLLGVLETYRPEQVLLCKSPLIRDYLTSYLHQHYWKNYDSHLGTHYLLRQG
jgi:hypothetical protein